MKTKNISLFMMVIIFLLSCSNEESEVLNNSKPDDFVVAFEKQSLNFSSSEKSKEIGLIFSEKAKEKGNVVISFSALNLEYGVDKDFIITPTPKGNKITIPIEIGDIKKVINVKKFKEALEGEKKSIRFKIDEINVTSGKIQGNKETILNFDETASVGGSIAPSIGGPNQPNQVYIDLSTGKQVLVKRDSWDLGFYSGDKFRVVLNGSIFMGASKIDATDINSVNDSIKKVQELKKLIKTGASKTSIYIDDVSGDINKTVIDEISSNDADNKVYLLRLGFKIGSKTPKVGSVELSGDFRGWKKIRILKKDNKYELQYADLNDTTFKKVIIEKNSLYNFTFFSFDKEKQVNVEPEKNKWDLNFTVFTNKIRGSYSYGFSDFVVTNLKAGANSYMVSVKDFKYEDFKKSYVDNTKFINDQRGIGSNWRSVFTKKVKSDLFFILKDVDGNIYKIKFTGFLNDKGERGHSKFEYKLLE